MRHKRDGHRVLKVTAEGLRDKTPLDDEYGATEKIKAEFRKLRAERCPFYLTGEDLDLVFRWKLRSHYERQAPLRTGNSDAAYRAVTEAVFKIVDDDRDREARLRLGLLVALPGVGVPVASAILALTDPDRYCVIDFRGWRAAFGELRETFSITDYLVYRAAVASLAEQLGGSVQETDAAIWEHDRRTSPRSRREAG